MEWSDIYVQFITDALISQIRAADIPYTDEQFPWYFPSISTYTTLLEAAGFHVGLAMHFARPTQLAGENGLKNWLAMFSPSLFEHVAPETTAQIFDTTAKQLRNTLYKKLTFRTLTIQSLHHFSLFFSVGIGD